MAEDNGRDIEMVVESVRVHMLSSRHVVILKETARDRYLPIWIGPWEASAIAMRLQGLTPERPLTHDLFASALGELGVRTYYESQGKQPYTIREMINVELIDAHEHIAPKRLAA